MSTSAALEQQIADAIKTWDDAFLEALCSPPWPRRGPAPVSTRGRAQFTPGYRGVFSPA